MPVGVTIHTGWSGQPCTVEFVSTSQGMVDEKSADHVLLKQFSTTCMQGCPVRALRIVAPAAAGEKRGHWRRGGLFSASGVTHIT